MKDKKPYDIREATGGIMWQERLRNQWVKAEKLKEYAEKIKKEREEKEKPCCAIQ